MCRLYALSATQPTRVECSLVHAQNALLAQSAEDLSGESHSEGWGIATYQNGDPQVERQAWAAYHKEYFKVAAATIYAKTVIAHIRKASVGAPSLANTHPFASGSYVFAHNGTVPAFPILRPKLVAMMRDQDRRAIVGQTDSEHIFAYIRGRLATAGAEDWAVTIGKAVLAVEKLSRDTAPTKALGLNIMITDGHRVIGSRIGRSLFAVERKNVTDCEICGFPHIRHGDANPYRATVVASEPLSHERWAEIPERSLWSIDPETKALDIRPLASLAD